MIQGYRQKNISETNDMSAKIKEKFVIVGLTVFALFAASLSEVEARKCPTNRGGSRVECRIK